MASRVVDSVALRCEPLILLLGRLCLGSLYLMSGINHWRELFAAAIGHRYWSINGDATAHWAQFIHFWRDIGLAGGALFVLARGAGPLSIDRG